MPSWSNNNNYNQNQNTQRFMNYPAQNMQRPMNNPMQNSQRAMNYPAQNSQRPMNYPMQNMQRPMNYPAQNSQRPMNYPMQNMQNMQNQMPHNIQPSMGIQPGMGMQPPGMPPAGTDGVTYQPIDINTLQDLKKSFEQGESQPPVKETQGDKGFQFEGNTPEYADNLEELIQNEKNASAFYAHLSSLASKPTHRRYLNEMVSDINARRGIFEQLYKNTKDHDFIPEDRQVELVTNYRNGLYRAIEEENISLKKLSRLYEEAADEKTARKINGLLYKKVGDLSFLHMAYNEN